jgi:hypothetical protein
MLRRTHSYNYSVAICLFVWDDGTAQFLTAHGRSADCSAGRRYAGLATVSQNPRPRPTSPTPTPRARVPIG